MTIAEPKKVLVTGAAGNVGSALSRTLLARNYHVVCVDNLSTGSPRKLPAGGELFRFIKADANDYGEISSILYPNRFDYVFHYAAVVGVKRTLENPLAVLRGIEGLKNVLSLSKTTGVRRVFFSSSSEVYGEPVTLPQHEETTPTRTLRSMTL